MIGSALAAEFAALVTALDRQLYARLLLESNLFWRIPSGIMVSDAKSLYEHLQKTGSIPKERHTMIDLMAVKVLVEIPW